MPETGKVVLIDHTAEFVFELTSGADLAVTVGDDTTAIVPYRNLSGFYRAKAGSRKR